VEAQRVEAVQAAAVSTEAARVATEKLAAIEKMSAAAESEARAATERRRLSSEVGKVKRSMCAAAVSDLQSKMASLQKSIDAMSVQLASLQAIVPLHSEL